jgi:hypothetical protein
MQGNQLIKDLVVEDVSDDETLFMDALDEVVSQSYFENPDAKLLTS